MLRSILLLASFAVTVAGFRMPAPATHLPRTAMPVHTTPTLGGERFEVAKKLRGGGPTMSAALTGAMALPACWGVATAACSLAFIRQAYVFSLSYGLSMAMIGGLILQAIPAGAPAILSYHAYLVIGYGVRLFGFLLWRQVGQDSGWAQRLAALDKTPRPKRAPIIVSTALFYALMASPLLFHLQSGSSALGMPFPIVSQIGCVAAAVGLLLEAVADHTKSMFKIHLRETGAADRPPTSGVWAYSRHANYLGE
jgi:steroid 5-alpha reductase family enzyme